jgi:hypothetical protein
MVDRTAANLVQTAIVARGADADHSGVATNPRVKRLTLVPQPGADDTLRRYRLARLEEVAFGPEPEPPARDSVQNQREDAEQGSSERHPG